MDKLAQIQRIALELQDRNQESIDLYEPLPVQLAFHTSNARERLFCSANQVGKTMAMCVEFALAFMGRHPKLPDKNGLAWLVALDGKALGDVFYKKLFQPGAFKIIRDKETMLWRCYKWWEEPLLEHEAIDAPPLIPERFVKTEAWDKSAERIPNMITSTTGWVFRFLTSKGEPERGVQCNVIGFDEEIANPAWYAESMARLLLKRGLFMWAVTPQVGTAKFYELYHAAKKMEDDPNARIRIFHMQLDDNPYLKPDVREQFKEQLKDDEMQYLARVKGIPAILGLRVFPEFTIRKDVMAVKSFAIPMHWTRYTFTDPGHQLCAVLFVAVPPPSEGDHIYIYDELYIKNCTAETYAVELKRKTQGYEFQDFIIDYQGARIHSPGDGKRMISHYEEALERHSIRCVAHGHGYTKSIPDVDAGVEAIRELMRPRADGTTRLRYLQGMVKNFEWEAENWVNKPKPKAGKGTRLQPEDRGRVHQMANLRYLALYRPVYVRPTSTRGTVAYQAYQDKMKRRRQLLGRPMVNCGPGGPLVDT